MRPCRVGLTVVALSVASHEGQAQQKGSHSLVWSIGMARGITLGPSNSGPDISRNEQSASLLFDWRRAHSRFGLRLELLRGIQDNAGLYKFDSGCFDLGGCYVQGQQTTTAALIGASYEFRQERRVRPYLLFGAGVQNSESVWRSAATCTGGLSSTCSRGPMDEQTGRDLYAVLTGGGGLSLNLGRFSAFAESRFLVRPTWQYGGYAAPLPPLSLGVRIRPEN